VAIQIDARVMAPALWFASTAIVAPRLSDSAGPAVVETSGSQLREIIGSHLLKMKFEIPYFSRVLDMI
jgi:hypothetical protein